MEIVARPSHPLSLKWKKGSIDSTCNWNMIISWHNLLFCVTPDFSPVTGTVGDWKQYFSTKQNRLFEELYNTKMNTSCLAKRIHYENWVHPSVQTVLLLRDFLHTRQTGTGKVKNKADAWTIKGFLHPVVGLCRVYQLTMAATALRCNSRVTKWQV